MKFGIGAKIVLLVIAVVILTAAVLGYSLLTASSAIVIDHEVVDLSDETSLRAYDLMSYLYRIRRGITNLDDYQADLKKFVSDGEAANLAALAEVVCTCYERAPTSYLRLEAWLADGEQLEPLNVVDQQLQRAQLVDDERASNPPMANVRSVLRQLAAPRDVSPSERLEVFLSDIGVVSVTEGNRSRRVNAVWCGTRITVPDVNRILYVAALVDLDAPLADGEQSPMMSIRNSTRHLSVLANCPPAESGSSIAESPSSDDFRFVFLNDTESYYKDDAILLETFRALNATRPDEYDELASSLVIFEEGDERPRRVELTRPLLYRQSNPISDQTLRKPLLDKIEQLSRDDPERLHGARIGMGGANDYFIRVLAGSEQAAQAAIDQIDRVAVEVSDELRISWRDAVECNTCETCYVLFRVGSAGVPGNVRYYGLARSAFLEEMKADVRYELLTARNAALAVVAIVTLVGFLASLLLTRPLKRITLAAEAVGKTTVESANNLWQQEIEAIGRMLPVQRGDEIGVLARAFRRMIGDLLAGQGRLQQLNANLDRLVTERTHELQRANTELQAARDKADELGRAKDAFLASVSHELRNPLNQVSGYCQLLELTELDQDQLADLKKIKQAGSQLLALINDILDYQKIVMGGITLEPELLEVAELLDEVRDAMKFPAEEQGNDLRVDWSDDVGKIYADKQRLRQVLLNLAGNACKFTQQGSVHIHAQRIPRNDAADEIAFSVADTGRGMTPEEQAKLFTPFTKLSAMQGNRAGTGLGLVISKGFSESMGGSIHLSSEYGKGSTFTVQIPATSPTLAASSSSLETFSSLTGSSRTGKKTFGHERVPPDDSIWRTVEFARVPAPPATGQTVLVIDDEADVREMMTRYLGARGFDVRTAASGIEGLELARMLRPVAITLDAIMPGLDGWAVLAALKADRELADIPVIMVTMVDNHRRGQIMGAAEYIVKPIDWQRLSRVLDRFVTANGNRSLLVVEDDESSREMMRRNLERDGWSVLEAVHGAEALEILAVRTPAAILLDLMMPVMDGFEFLNRQSADARAIPIIVITAKDPTPAEYERLNGRAARVLLKGQYTQEDLLQEIHRWVDGHVQGTTAIPGDKQNA